VILTHIIKCRVDVEEFRAALDVPVCKICQANAQVYCENDHEYFCQTCDELAHEGDEDVTPGDERARILNQLRLQHNRVPVQESAPHRFGFCSEHPKRPNEYYDRLRNQAFCTMCAIDMAQGKKDGQNNMVSLESAYSAAKKRARNPDAALEQRKQMIRNQMDQISGKIAAIKNQA